MNNKAKTVFYTVLSIFIFSTILTSNAFCQDRSGLFYTEKEISIWKERVGLTQGKTLYKSYGDASQNSPGDWDRIFNDAVTAINSPGNDRFNNYDTHSPIAELWNTQCCGPSNSGRPIYGNDRKQVVDDREPRPNTNGDHSANSVLNAGYVHLLLGDQGTINANGRTYSGKEFANAVKNELLHYSNDNYLDFTNRARWVVGSAGFADRNPGFFIAEWCTKMLFAYDYTKYSTAYSASERQKIENWIKNAASFFDGLYNDNLDRTFGGGRKNDNYSNIPGSYRHSYANRIFDGGEPVYHISTDYNNRRSAQFRFSFLTGILFGDSKLIENGKRAFKEWVAFGTFIDGSHADMYRGGAGANLKTGLGYTSSCVEHAVTMADAYARKFDNSLYEYEINDQELKKFFPSVHQSRGWYKGLAVKGKNLKNTIETFLRYFDGSYGNSRAWGGANITGTGEAYDTWVCHASVYYNAADPSWANNIKNIYTRTKSGTSAYPSNPKTGSFDEWAGPANIFPAKLLLFGQMEGKIWPYNGEGAPEIPSAPVEPTEPETPVDIAEGTKFEAEDFFQKMTDIGVNGEVKTSDDLSGFLSEKKGVQLYDKGDKLRFTFKVENEGAFLLKVRLRAGSAANPTSYLENGYKFLVDNYETGFKSDLSSVSTKDNNFGGAYWGSVISSELPFSKGEHTLDIEAVYAWGVVDFIEVISLDEEPEPETRVLTLNNKSIDFGEVEVGESKTISVLVTNEGNADLDITSFEVPETSIKVEGKGAIKGGESKEIIVTYTPTASEIVDGKIIIKSDKTDGDNEIEINAIGNEPITSNITSIVFEAENNFETARNSGTKGDVKVSDDTSPLLGDSKAVQIYDKGDIVKINFNIPAKGKYQIKVRLRSGSLAGSTAYWPNGYNIKLNGASSGFIGDLESVSQKDDNFGGSYWGDMVSEWLTLEKGVNYIEVEALTYWGAVDYIEVIGDNLPDQTIELSGDLSFGSLDVHSSLSKTLTITNSGTDILKVEKLSFSTPEFSGNWSGEIAGGSSQDVSVVFSPTEEGIIEGTVEVISDAVNGNVSLVLTGEGVVQKSLTQRLEAEDWFEVVGEFGAKAPIMESNGTSSELGNEKAVQIYDKGDELRIPFNIEKSDKYFIRVRLRSGNTNSNTAYWPTGYEFKVDGTKQGFIGDESSISAKDSQFGISYWGTMESDMMEFSEGVHYLNVSAILSWGLVDYIEIVHESESSKRNGGSLGDASSITLGESNVELTVFPNPTSDVVYFEMDIEEQNVVGEWVILNTNGKIIYQKELFSGHNSETVSLRNFGPGLYFTILNVNGNKISRKILVK